MEAKEIITKRRIEALATQASKYGISDSILNSYYSQTNKSNEPRVFISHSSLEKDFVKKVLLFLYHTKGIAGYVDWQDPDLPSETNAVTAKTLKTRIESALKVIYI